MKVLEIGFKSLLTIVFLCAVSSLVAFGQQPNATPTPTVIFDQTKREMPIATGNNLYCAGYIQNTRFYSNYEIVGADRERDQNIFQQGNYVYIGRGANTDIKVGDMFSVVRPRGGFKSKFSKKGKLGTYIMELGAVEVVKVKSGVAVARVKTSCDNFLMGDLLVPVTSRVSPTFRQRPGLDLFGEPSGKATGRLVLARDGRESPTRDDIVYIDLGEEDNVRVGEYLTIYRPLGKGGVINHHQEDTHLLSSSDFGSDRYKGGKFSNNSPRESVRDIDGETVTYNDVIKRRPKNLRQVVGEMVILNVKERTATAVITRTVTEIHTGDMVEVQ